MVSLAFEQPMEIIVQNMMMGNTSQRGEWTWETWSASATSTYTTDRKIIHVCGFFYIVCRKPLILTPLRFKLAFMFECLRSRKRRSLTRRSHTLVIGFRDSFFVFF